ncbi:hypothetical protein DYB32_002839 [Aphanomyces invadans]|uniref:F-box domain-containing protein n=1 Tax=Aphanomyces invadans TaxID=157072 RepID=A0A418B2B6_9STRA|nr:hypothetical protein DYB32_002839 [Aphanomyces invadans]
MFSVAQVLLLLALYCFENAPIAVLMQSAAVHDVGPKPNLVLGVILGVVACCVFALVDMILLRSPNGAASTAIPAFPTTVCAILALVASISPVFYLQGRVIYRVLGCTLWSLTIVLGSIFTYTLWCQDDSADSTLPHPLYGVLTGSLGLLTHLVLLHSMASPGKTALLPWLPHTNHRMAVAVGVVAVLILHLDLQHVVVDSLTSVLFHPLPLLLTVCVGSFCVVVMTMVRLLQPTMAVACQSMDFPRDIVHHLATFLSPSELAALAASSKHHQALITPAIWHSKFVAQLHAPPHVSATVVPVEMPLVRPSTLFANTWINYVERLVLSTLFPNTHAICRSPLLVPPNMMLHWRHYAVVTPLQCMWESHHMAHRTCLERCRASICGCAPPPRTDSTQDTLQPALRTPVTVSEFLAIAVFTRRFVVSASPSVAVCAMSVLLCGSLSGLVTWTGGIAILGAIVRSVDFDRAVEQIWIDPPAFPVYIRIINTLGLSSFVQLVSALWIDPSVPLQVAFAINTMLFVVMTVTTGLVFWKANTYLLTYTSPTNTTAAVASHPSPRRSCVLCRLHLCRITSASVRDPPHEF